jgi:hypothetical protein
MYNFAADGYSQLVRFTGCHAGQGRHAFVSNGTTCRHHHRSGVVWHRCTMDGGDAEAHRRWSQGLLFDNVREVSGGPGGRPPALTTLARRPSHGYPWLAERRCYLHNGSRPRASESLPPIVRCRNEATTAQ